MLGLRDTTLVICIGLLAACSSSRAECAHQSSMAGTYEGGQYSTRSHRIARMSLSGDGPIRLSVETQIGSDASTSSMAGRWRVQSRMLLATMTRDDKPGHDFMIVCGLRNGQIGFVPASTEESGGFDLRAATARWQRQESDGMVIWLSKPSVKGSPLRGESPAASSR